MKRFLQAGFLVAALSLAACGKAAVGETCDTIGSTTDECVDGAICDSDKGANKCLKTCTADTDCNATTENCTGVSGGGTTKACHTK